MDRIQKQASDLWELLFDEETAQIYQSALNLTGKILLDIAQLIWLSICSVFVFAAWFSDASVKAGNSIRAWVDQQTGDTAPAGESKPLSEKGKDLLDASRVTTVKLLNKAREELGLEAEPLPKPTAEKTAKPLPAPSSAPTASPATLSPETSKTTVTKTTAPPTAPKPKTSAPQPTEASASSTKEVTGDMDEDTDFDEETEDESWPPQGVDE